MVIKHTEKEYHSIMMINTGAPLSGEMDGSAWRSTVKSRGLPCTSTIYESN
jgi:hypothetical protein